MAKTAEVSERAKPVLDGIKAGKSPADIAKEMGISVNGVHGHIRRLRKNGNLPAAKARANTKTKAERATAKRTTARKTTSNGRRAVSRARLSPIVAAMRKANGAAEKRIAEIDAEQEKLANERKELVEARKG